MEDKARGWKPSYMPWKTFFGFFERVEEKGLPDRVDRSYLSNMSGIDQSYLIMALKGFGLMDEDGRPTEALTPLISKETRPAAIRKLLETFYPQAVALPPNATQAQLDETFRPYGLGADPVRKAQTFYLRAADYSGISLSQNFKNPAAAPGGSAGRTSRPRSPKKKAGNSASGTSATPVVNSPPAVSRDGVLTNVHEMLSGSIRWLAEHGPTWTEPQAEAWLGAFTAQVRLVYPTTRPRTAASPKSTPRPEAEESPSEALAPE
jgi:hypothetical protein